MSETQDKAVNEVLRYGPMKYILIVVFSLLAIIMVVVTVHHFIRCNKGLNSKLFWGMDECLECKDTTITVNKIIKHDTTTKIDTVKITKYISSTEKKSAKTDTSKSVGKFLIPNATFNGPTQVGDNNTQHNNIGIIPRNITSENFLQFFSTFPDKHTHIAVSFQTNPDSEMLRAKSTIIEILKKKGYNNVGTKSEFGFGGEIAKNIYYELRQDSSVMFWIPPAQ